jgi:hypothetical protein
MSSENIITLKCPNCDAFFEVKEKEINCKIFRHASLKSNHEPINPHASKKKCEQLVKKGLVYGCAKPFELYKEGDTWKARKCEYK